MKNYILLARLAMCYPLLVYSAYKFCNAWHIFAIAVVLFIILFSLASFIKDTSKIGKILKVYSLGLLFSIVASSAITSVMFIVGCSNLPTMIVASSVIFIMLYGILFGLSNIKVRRFTIYFKNLPDSLEGKKISQFSDLHSEEYVNKKPLEKLLKILKTESPDFTFFTGDFINGDWRELIPFISIFKQMNNVYAIKGNHDYGDYFDWKSEESLKENQKMLTKVIRDEMGWDLLLNESRMITKDVALIGVENWSKKKRLPKYGDIENAIKGVADAQFKILLTHDPTHLEEEVYPNYDIDLSFCGHTHGAQMGIRTDGIWNWIRIKFSPASIVFKQWGDSL